MHACAVMLLYTVTSLQTSSRLDHSTTAVRLQPHFTLALRHMVLRAVVNSNHMQAERERVTTAEPAVQCSWKAVASQAAAFQLRSMPECKWVKQVAWHIFSLIKLGSVVRAADLGQSAAVVWQNDPSRRHYRGCKVQFR